MNLHVLSILHPAFLLRDQWGFLPAQQIYLRRFAKLVTNAPDAPTPTDTTQPPPGATILPTPQQVLDYLAHPDNHQGVACDIENPGDVLRIVGFCRLSDLESIAIKVYAQSGGPCWNAPYQQQIESALREFLADPTVPKWFHNGQQHDSPELEKYGFPVQGYYEGGDTLLMQRFGFAEQPAGLQYCAITHLGMGAWKHLTRAEDEGAEGK